MTHPISLKEKLFRVVFALLITGILLVLPISQVAAQNYSFAVDKMVVNVYINSQGVMSVDYVYDFSNNSGASPIDIIDLGLPSTDYDISSVKADVGGKAITDISPSPYVSGIAVGLGNNAIQPGSKGTVHIFIATIRQILYPYTQSSASKNVSFNFSPNYFDSRFVTGSTDETVSLHLPPSIQSNEPIYYNPQGWPGDSTPQSSYDSSNQVTYTWQSTSANSSTQYIFGAAFPASYVPASAVVTKPTPEPFTGSSSGSSSGSGSIFGSGNCTGPIVVIFIVIAIFSSLGGRTVSQRSRLAYLPPKISMEGHGIKRGLTAVEVAILMELPMDKILTMILFGVIKKGAATVETKDPLKLNVASPLPEGLYAYETAFLDAFKHGTSEDRAHALQDMMVALVKSVSEKMKGFSLKETVAYYKDIMEQAWKQVEAADTPEVKGQKLDEGLEWTMLDHQFNTRVGTVLGPNPIFIPIWWGRFDPVFRSQGPVMPTSFTPSVPGGGGQPSISMPKLPGSDFAASVINGTSSFAAGAIGNLTNFTSGISAKTNPPPPPSSSGGSRGGGGGFHCACACACAGCACACAGGGR